MELKVTSTGRSFSGYLHYIIYDDTDYVIATSYAGLEISVKAISSSIIEGRNLTVIQDQKPSINLKSLAGEYRRVEKAANGPIFHGVVLGKAAVFEENKEAPVVIAWDGDVRNAVGRFMAARYTLPKEWIDQYIDLIPSDGIECLNVLINPLNTKYKDLKAIRISSKFAKEDYVLAAIDQCLLSRKLVIPPADPSMPKGKFVPGWSMKEYLTNNAPVLAAQLKNVRPRHVPGQDPLDPEIATMARTPFPAQAHMIQGLYNALQYQDSVFCGADMGCGKSIMALGVAHLMHKAKGGKGMSVLLVAPGITVPKWRDNEIAKTLPDAKVRIIKSTADAARYAWEVKNGYEPDGLEFVLVGLDRSKLGPEPWPTAIWKRVSGAKYKAWHCPDCGKPLYDPEAEADGVLAYWDALAQGLSPEKAGYTNSLKTSNNLPLGFDMRWRRNSKLKQCQHCDPKHEPIKSGKGKLLRPALKDRGETKNRPRYFISRILKGLRKHFDLYICDEVHQTKSEDSGRGDAFAQMVKSGKKMLFLTGTLVNGKSTSIKEILWRTDPAALIKDGFNHKSGMVAWASRFGVLKKVTRVTVNDTGYVTRKKRVQLQPVEEPGISPQMIAQFLLHKVAFMELGDLGLPLVNLVERPVFIDMDQEHEKHYRSFHDNLYQKCKQAMALGAKGAFSKFIPSTIVYGDRPDLGASVEIGGDIITAPKLDGYHAKERLLVDMVTKELAEDRGVIIYAYYTDSYAVNYRLRDVLKDHGIDSHVLTSSVPSEKRVEWLAQKEKEGAKVLIANQRLVEVGLDLIAWPTIIAVEYSYNVSDDRQAWRRNWRIGQYKESRIYLMIYNGTQQMSQFLNVMTKRGHALMAEGRLDRGELAQYCRDAHNTMASDLANCLADAKVADRWTELARKDLDPNLKIVDGKVFKAELEKTMEELTNETRRLCGVMNKDMLLIIQKQEKPSIVNMWDMIKEKKTKVSEQQQISLLEFGLGA